MHRPSASSAPHRRRSLLAPDELPPFETLGRGGALAALVVCDHASRRIPQALADLGLPPPAQRRHIAWDIGAGPLAQGLAARLGVRALLAGYSRLVIDCNRKLEDPTSIAAESDGQTIPGNLALDAAARLERQLECFWPYHEAIDAELAHLAQRAGAPTLIAVHSFTPQLQGVDRPWHCGILWDRDGRIARPLMQALRAHGDLVVGDNQPYSGRDPEGFTVDVHAARRGWPHVCIEVRQDQLTHAEGVARWAALLGDALEPILADPALNRPRTT